MWVANALLFTWRHADSDLIGKSPSHRTLKTEHVAQVSVVAPGPQGLVLRRVDELGSDADPVAGPHYGTFNHPIHAKFARDLRQRFCARLIGIDRSVRNNL